MTFTPFDFICESNAIEGIHREPTAAEFDEYHRFMAYEEVDIAALNHFVKVYQSNARIRDKYGLNVRVGNHYPPPGGPEILGRLQAVLDIANAKRLPEYTAFTTVAYHVHQSYEHLHPFTDGNGRSGRMLWMWMMREAPLGFLHTWYYQSLRASR